MNVAQNWRLNAQRYNLVGSFHADGSVNFPPRPTAKSRENYEEKAEDSLAVTFEEFQKKAEKLEVVAS